jgi:glycosyltransferase involved in cell wall biosynthesis
VTGQVGPGAADVELIVSDNSTSDKSEQVARPLLAAWPGPTSYVRNTPPVGMVENHNRCLKLASGRSIAFLHDDDVMRAGALETITRVVADPNGPAVHLFGVDVVNLEGRIRRRQVPRLDEVLPPELALRRLLTRSSYIRLPGLVVRADAYRAVGPFDSVVGSAIDFDMWVRLFARYGLHTVPRVVAAYTVHEAGLTTGMFTPATVASLVGIFDRAAEQRVLSPAEIRRCQATWFHQFILAGAYRHLERRDRSGAAEVMTMFNLPAIRALGRSTRWLPVRIAFSLLVAGARPHSSASTLPGPGR